MTLYVFSVNEKNTSDTKEKNYVWVYFFLGGGGVGHVSQ